MSEVTRVLAAIDAGDPHASEQLLPLVYAELRRLAAHKLAQEKPGQTLDATGLVHEAYLRLVDVDEAQHWNSRGHFFAAAAEAMRRILVEGARRKATRKRGQGAQRLDPEQLTLPGGENAFNLLELNDALAELETHNPQAAQLVKLRYFGGLAHQEAAQALGVGRRAADRLWALARAWLYRQVGDE